MKGFSKSQAESFQFEECCNCLIGDECQKECDKIITHSTNHELSLQKIPNKTLLPFAEKRYFINEIKSTPCNWHNSIIIHKFII